MVSAVSVGDTDVQQWTWSYGQRGQRSHVYLGLGNWISMAPLQAFLKYLAENP